MCRSTDWRNAWPLLSSRLNRFVRQNPFNRTPRPRQVGDHLRLGAVVGGSGRLVDVVAQAVPGERQAVDRVHDRGGVEGGVLVRRVAVVDLELDRPGLADGEVRPRSVRERQELAAGLGVGVGVVVLDEASGSGGPCRGASARASRRRTRSSRTRPATGGEHWWRRMNSVIADHLEQRSRAGRRCPCLRAGRAATGSPGRDRSCCTASPRAGSRGSRSSEGNPG